MSQSRRIPPPRDPLSDAVADALLWAGTVLVVFSLVGLVLLAVDLVL